MPPFVQETVAWLRYYTLLPIPPLPGEAEPTELARAAYAAPVAGAIIGLIGALILLAAWALRLPVFLAAALAVLALIVVTGAVAERAVASLGDQLGSESAVERTGAAAIGRYGVLLLVIAALLRVGAVEGLAAFGIAKAALALVAAGAISRAAALSFASIQPVSRAGGIGIAVQELDYTSLQWLGLVTLLIVAVAILPAYGVGPTVAGLAAGIAAAAAVSAFTPRAVGESTRESTGVSEQAAEIAFLIAVLAFAR